MRLFWSLAVPEEAVTIWLASGLPRPAAFCRAQAFCFKTLLQRLHDKKHSTPKSTRQAPGGMADNVIRLILNFFMGAGCVDVLIQPSREGHRDSEKASGAGRSAPSAGG